jgi:hypothetical protein
VIGMARITHDKGLKNCRCRQPGGKPQSVEEKPIPDEGLKPYKPTDINTERLTVTLESQPNHTQAEGPMIMTADL